MKTKIIRWVLLALGVVFVVTWALYGAHVAFISFSFGSLLVFLGAWAIGLAFCERSKPR